jgi:hypothetical protein
MKMTVFWDVELFGFINIYRRFRIVSACIITMTMAAVSISRKSVSFFQTTRRKIPEDSRVQDTGS